MDADRKNRIAIATARIARRAGKRLTKRETAQLGRRIGPDWRYVREMADTIGRREPGWVAIAWAGWLGVRFKSEVRMPRRFGWTHAGPELARHLGFWFGWLGPNNGIWPGDFLALSAPRPDGCANGWRVVCATDCPCGKCWRPLAPITDAVADAYPSLKDETPGEYFARVTAAISRPGVRKTSLTWTVADLVDGADVATFTKQDDAISFAREQNGERGSRFQVERNVARSA